MCGQVFITHGENLHSSKHWKQITASWLAFKMQLWLTEACAPCELMQSFCSISIPTTGNLACPLIPSQTPTQCLPSGNTEVKSATEVSPICRKCWRRRQQFEARGLNVWEQQVVAEVKRWIQKVLLLHLLVHPGALCCQVTAPEVTNYCVLDGNI